MKFLKSLFESLVTVLTILIITIIIAALFGGLLKVIYSIFGIEFNEDIIFDHSWILTILWIVAIILSIFIFTQTNSQIAILWGARLIVLGVGGMVIGLFGLHIKDNKK